MRRERYIPEHSVELTHSGKVSSDFAPCVIGHDIVFDAEGMQSYFARDGGSIIYDCLLIAAAVDFCDHGRPRPQLDWSRRFRVRVPVHHPEIWTVDETQQSLSDALGFLTGDIWQFEFVETDSFQPPLRQVPLDLMVPTDAVVPFSDGLDSRAVFEILRNELGDGVVLVRLSTRKKNDAPRKHGMHVPFTTVPFRVKKRHAESSGRSRGFKFAMISGLAGHLLDAKRVVVAESGQGAIGPALVNVGHGHPDCRTHPRFLQKMADFLECVLGKRPVYDHPMLWKTKGETVSRYIDVYPNDNSWRSTRSCWQSAQQMSIEGRHRQCGVCAACMLRRMSLHTAGLKEEEGTYVWDDLTVSDFWDGAHEDLTHQHSAFMEYGLAGTLHLDHLARLVESPQYLATMSRQSLFLSRSLGLPIDETRSRVEHLLGRHAREWDEFLASLGKASFVRKWVEIRD